MEPIRFQHPQFPAASDIERHFAPARETRWFSNGGPCHALLTDRLARFVGRDVHIVLVANATLGLMLTLRTLVKDSTRGRMVIVPSFTFPATIQAIRWNGLEPLWVDVEPHGWHMDPQALDDAIAAHGSDIAAVLACSTFGTAPSVKQSGAWREACARAELPLIVDSAPGFGARDEHGQPLGTQGDAEVFSFHATKPFAIGEGGAVSTTDAKLAKHLTTMTNFAFEADREIHNPFGMNAKLSEMHAAIGLAVLERFDQILHARRERAEEMRNALQHYGYDFQLGSQNSTWQFVPVLAPSTEAREAVLAASCTQHIEIRNYHPPLHSMSAFAGYLAHGDLPVTEMLVGRTLSLPLANDLSRSGIKRIIDLLKECATATHPREAWT